MTTADNLPTIDSTHWTGTRGVIGGVAVSSLDVRRVMEAAAARQRRLNWAERWALRVLVRLTVWRAAVKRWGARNAPEKANVAAPRPEAAPGKS